MKHNFNIISAFILMLVLFSCEAISQKKTDVRKVKLTAPQGKAIAAFAEGCFWCSEHIFEAVVGVDSAISGYRAGQHILFVQSLSDKEILIVRILHVQMDLKKRITD